MIRILISAPSMNAEKNVSGVSSVVIQIRRALCRDVEFRHLEIGSEQRGGKCVRLLGSIAKIARSAVIVSTSLYDVFHSNTAINPKSIVRDLVMVIIARSRGKAVLLHIHGGTYVHESPPRILGWFMKLLFELSSYIVTLSQHEKVYFVEAFPEIATKIGFIYNGLDLFEGLGKLEGDAASSDWLRVAFVGRLAPEKGLAALIQACHSLDIKAGIWVDFFGAGVLLPEVLTLAHEKAFVTYRGVFQPAESRKVLRNFDVLVLPSLSGEGMPMAIVEAMSVGVVPVCTPISSIPEIITSGTTGVLIPVGSPEAIVDALLQLQLNPEGRHRMACAAYKFAMANFDASINYRKLNDLYRTISPRSCRDNRTPSQGT